MRKLLIGLALPLAFLSSVALADTSTECHNCSSSQKAQAAMNATGQSEYVFVMDYGKSELIKYYVLVEYDAEVGSITKWATPVSQTTTEKNA